MAHILAMHFVAYPGVSPSPPVDVAWKVALDAILKKKVKDSEEIT